MILNQQPVNLQHPFNQGLISWWLNLPQFQNRGSSTFRDLMRRNDGTLTNMDAVDWVGAKGRPGGFGAHDFDGSTNYIDILDSSTLIDGLASITFSCWFNATSHVSWPLLIGCRGAGSINSLGWNSNNGSLEMRINGTGINTSATFTADLGTWYFATATYDGSTMRIYVNGSEKANGAKTGTLLQSAILRIGWDDFATSRRFNGQIDDVRIHDRAHSAEVFAQYQNSKAGHPQTLNWIQPTRFFVPPVAGGGTILPFMNHYLAG